MEGSSVLLYNVYEKMDSGRAYALPFFLNKKIFVIHTDSRFLEMEGHL